MKSSTRRPLRTWSILLAALITLLTLSAIALKWFWPEDELQQQLTQHTSEWLGVPINIRGDIALTFWPRPGIQAEAVTLGPESPPDSDTPALAELSSLTLAVRWLPLLRGRLVPDALLLNAPILHLEDGASTLLSLGPEPDDNGPRRESAPFDLRVHDGEIHWHDKARELQLSITGLDLTSTGWRWSPPADDQHPLAGASMDLSASIGSLRLNALTLSDLTFDLSGENGVFRIDNGKMNLLQSHGTGEATLDFSSSPPTGTLNLDFDAVNLAHLPDAWLPGGSTSGTVALRASLESQGRQTDELWRHLNGHVQLSGQNLVLRGVDLDAELAQYHRTQRFSLVDAAAVAFVGPAWLLATKGSDFARLLGTADGGETHITQLVSDWEIKNGTALTRDVALATAKNRLAAQASLDLANQRINHATVAAIDQRGCAVLEQTMHGPFSAPQTEPPNAVEELLGAPIDLLRRGLNAITGGKTDCEVFYQGAVRAPAN